MTVHEPGLLRSVQLRFLSNFTLWRLSFLLVLVGVGVSSYLSYARISGVPLVCTSDGHFNCDLVQNSSYSKFFGIPVAYLGVLSYIMIGFLLVLQPQVAYLRENGLLILFGLVSIAFMFSMYLVYAQGVLLAAWCIWCLSHEAIISTLFVLTGYRLWNELKQRGN